MAKPKRKLTAREKADKKRRKLEYETIFINGKQKRVKRSPAIDGLPANEFTLLNANPIWLHQNGERDSMEAVQNSNIEPYALRTATTK